MSELVFGILCIVLAVRVLRMPEERFRCQLAFLTGVKREILEWYYRLLRGLFWGVGAAGAAIILFLFV